MATTTLATATSQDGSNSSTSRTAPQESQYLRFNCCSEESLDANDSTRNSHCTPSPPCCLSAPLFPKAKFSPAYQLPKPPTSVLSPQSTEPGSAVTTDDSLLRCVAPPRPNQPPLRA
mmetsp:Transcript_31869/g.68258  ORF Transcript_31869/g.68258 Transcript_31869/m.68258 type:complete len:117 (-) Transcript_31869:316-666(-)